MVSPDVVVARIHVPITHFVDFVVAIEFTGRWCTDPSPVLQYEQYFRLRERERKGSTVNCTDEIPQESSKRMFRLAATSRADAQLGRAALFQKAILRSGK
jgi:hypothetical protein